MLIGLKTLKTNTASHNMTSWFDGDEEKHVQPKATSQMQIRSSIKSISRAVTAVPALPRFAQQNKSASPYTVMSAVLDANSESTRALAQYGLAAQFASTDCVVDMSMMADGGLSAVLRAPSGFRRTVVVRVDGAVSQRVTGPRGEEIVRFGADGKAIYLGEQGEVA